MAGAFTHWMIAEEAVSNMPDGDYATILGEKINFVRIGAVGPDYPYLSELDGKLFKIHSWADRMHYENSLQFVKNGLSDLLAMGRDSEKFKICLAWLCGYVSHLLADTIIHPVVNENVGGTYIFTSHDHIICEMTQDSKIFYNRKGIDLSNAGYISLLQDCSDPTDKNRIHEAVRDYWPNILKNTHRNANKYFDKIDPDKWHAAYLSKLGMATNPIPIFRHVGEEMNLVYKKDTELRNSEEERKYYAKIRLPDTQAEGNFKEHAFDKTVNKVVEVWQKLFIDISAHETSNCQASLRNWNLDTGLDEDRIFFW
jgi:Zinc dependent phospholipase C